MKNIILFSLTFIFFFLSSCSKDSENDEPINEEQISNGPVDNGPVNNDKTNIVKKIRARWYKQNKELSWEEVSLFSYNANGKLITIEISGSNTEVKEHELVSYKYNNDEIIFEDDGNEYNGEYHSVSKAIIKEGKVQSVTCDCKDGILGYSFFYENGYISKSNYSYDNKYALATWENGNLINIKVYKENECIENSNAEYGTELNNSNIDLNYLIPHDDFFNYSFDDDIYLKLIGICGTRSKNLLSKTVSSSSDLGTEISTIYSYIIGTKGEIQKINAFCDDEYIIYNIEYY